MSYLAKHLQTAMDIPSSTMSLIMIMAAVAMYFVRNHLVVPGMIVVIYPLVVTFAVAANYVFILLELFPMNKMDQWLIATISASTIGIIMGLGLSALLAQMLGKMEQRKSRFHRT
jgi:hypothetical protein